MSKPAPKKKPAAKAKPVVAKAETKPAKPVSLKVHPLADRFPPMTDQEFAALKTSIAPPGQQIEPIVLLEGKILDGRHRARACDELGIAPKTIDFNPAWGDPVQYVISKASHRNMTIAQRACAAERFMDDLSKSRKLGRPADGERKNALLSGKSSEIAAECFGVSPRNIEEVRKLRQENDELYNAVFCGRININQARNRLRLNQTAASVVTARRVVKYDPSDLRTIHGDCVAEMRKLEAGSVRCIFADPPYNIGWTYDADETGDKRTPEEFVAWCQEWILPAANLLADDGSIFVLINGEYSDQIGMLLRSANLHRRGTIVWWETFGAYTAGNFTNCTRFIHYYTRKAEGFVFNGPDICIPSDRLLCGDNRANPAGKVPTNVWPISRKQGTATDRVPFPDAPPQLPLELPERCILAATNHGDTVLDPFNGNGTTGIAALKWGRKYIGIDRSAKYLNQSRHWIKAQLGTSEK